MRRLQKKLKPPRRDREDFRRGTLSTKMIRQDPEQTIRQSMGEEGDSPDRNHQPPSFQKPKYTLRRERILVLL